MKKQGLAENTVVFFSSDNGPESLPFGPQNHGSTGGLRGAKRETFEGGLRVPFLVRWPGHIAADSVNGTPAVGMDLFPTLFPMFFVASVVHSQPTAPCRKKACRITNYEIP